MANNQKILVVEDDTLIRDVYEEVLLDARFSVATAIDGQDGLNKAQEGGFNR